MARILTTLAGVSHFQSGTGDGSDLQVRLQQSPEGGWFPAVRPGFYYLGTEEQYLYASKGTYTTTLATTGLMQGFTIGGLAFDPTRRGPVRLLKAGSPRPLQRVSSPLRAFRSVAPVGSGTVQTIQLPASGLLVSLLSDPVTGLLLSVPATGDILATDEYTYEPVTARLYLQNPSPPPLYATFLVDEVASAVHSLRQEEVLHVSRDGLVRTMFGPVLCAGSGSVLLPIVKKPTAAGWYVALGSIASGNVITLGGSGAYTQLVRRDAPTVWWRLNEPSGTVLVDRSATGKFPATSSGSLTFNVAGGITSEGGVAITWDGSAAQANSSGTVAVPASFSAEAWVNFTFFDRTRPVLSNRTAGGVSGFYFGTSYGSLWFADANANPAGAITGQRFIADGQWHHVVVAADGVTTRLYVDGLLDQQTTQSRAAFANLLSAAGDQDGTHFGGSLNDLALYPSCLSPAQVLDHFEAGAAQRGPISSGDIVACRYYVSDSFTAIPSGSGLAISVLPVAAAVGNSYTVEYETGGDWYYNSLEASGSVQSIQLNPLLTPRDSGFLYLCDPNEPWAACSSVRVEVSNHNPLWNPSGCAPVVFVATALDSESEPIPQTALTVTASGASGTLALQYPGSPVTDGRGQLRYTWTPQGTGVVTFTATVSGGGASGTLDLSVRDWRHYTAQAEYQLGKLILALETTPYRNNLRRLLAYYCYADGAPFQPDGTSQSWQATVTFSALSSSFYTLEGLPLSRPCSLSTDSDGLAVVLVDARPGDLLRAEVRSASAARKRVACPVWVPDLSQGS